MHSHGSIVAFEGPPDILATQLCLLPASPNILVLPNLEQYLQDDGHDDRSAPFDARLFLRRVHEATRVRHVAAEHFLQSSSAADRRLVFLNGGAAAGHALCLETLRTRDAAAAGDLQRAVQLLDDLVADMAREEEQQQKLQQRSLSSRSHSPHRPHTSYDPDADPSTRAMLAAEALDRETESLQQPSSHALLDLDLTIRPRRHSLSLPIHGHRLALLNPATVTAPATGVPGAGAASGAGPGPRGSITDSFIADSDYRASTHTSPTSTLFPASMRPEAIAAAMAMTMTMAASPTASPVWRRSGASWWSSSCQSPTSSGVGLDHPPVLHPAGTMIVGPVLRGPSRGGPGSDDGSERGRSMTPRRSSRSSCWLLGPAGSHDSPGSPGSYPGSPGSPVSPGQLGMSFLSPSRDQSLVRRPSLGDVATAVDLWLPHADHKPRSAPPAPASPSHRRPTLPLVRVERSLSSAKSTTSTASLIARVVPVGEDIVLRFTGCQQPAEPALEIALDRLYAASHVVVVDPLPATETQTHPPVQQYGLSQSQPHGLPGLPGLPHGHILGPGVAMLPETPTSPPSGPMTVAPLNNPSNNDNSDDYDPFAPHEYNPVTHLKPAPPRSIFSASNTSVTALIKTTTTTTAQPPTPACTPPPAADDAAHASRPLFIDFPIARHRTPAALQNALRVLLRDRLGDDDVKHETAVDSDSDSDEENFLTICVPPTGSLWTPLTGSDGATSRADLILALGVQKGVRPAFSDALAARLSALGTTNNSTSRTSCDHDGGGGGCDQLDVRYLVAAALQARAVQVPADAIETAATANAALAASLAALIVPQLELYLRTHPAVRLLLLHYPAGLFLVVQELQRLLGRSLVQVAGVTAAAAAVANGPFAGADLVLPGGAPEPEVAAFVAAVWRRLVGADAVAAMQLHSPPQDTRPSALALSTSTHLVTRTMQIGGLSPSAVAQQRSRSQVSQQRDSLCDRDGRDPRDGHSINSNMSVRSSYSTATMSWRSRVAHSDLFDGIDVDFLDDSDLDMRRLVPLFLRDQSLRAISESNGFLCTTQGRLMSTAAAAVNRRSIGRSRTTINLRERGLGLGAGVGVGVGVGAGIRSNSSNNGQKALKWLGLA